MADDAPVASPPPPSSTTAAASPLPIGFRITISDGVYTSYDWVIISITDHPNAAPIVDAGPAQSVEAEHWVGLDGRASLDPNANAAWYIRQGGPGAQFPRRRLPNHPYSTRYCRRRVRYRWPAACFQASAVDASKEPARPLVAAMAPSRGRAGLTLARRADEGAPNCASTTLPQT